MDTDKIVTFVLFALHMDSPSACPADYEGNAFRSGGETKFEVTVPTRTDPEVNSEFIWVFWPDVGPLWADSRIHHCQHSPQRDPLQ